MFGVDLAAWVAAGRWLGVLELIHSLPRSSRLREAQLNDPDVAADLLELQEAQDEPEEWAPALAETSLITDLLSALIGEVRSLRSEQTAIASGKKPRPVKPIPGPRTALETAKALRAEKYAAETLSRFGF